MTSELRDDVSVPGVACFSRRSVVVLGRDWSWRAMARPTTPPPMMAWVKSASRLRDVENRRVCDGVGGRDRARANILMLGRLG